MNIDVISKDLSSRLNDVGIKQHSEFYYIDQDITNDDSGISAFTLSEINEFLKYYDKYFKVDFDINTNSWKIDKNIFKIYFLNPNKRKYMGEFIEIHKKDYKTKVEVLGEILYFLISSNFIDSDDLNN